MKSIATASKPKATRWHRHSCLRRSTARGVEAGSQRRAFTLLEVILALAILATSLAALGEVLRTAIRSATEAEQLTQAEILAASKMSELMALGYVPSPVQGSAFDSVMDGAASADWSYSVNVLSLNEPALVAVEITVTQAVATANQPLSYTLTRWMVDPDAMTALIPITPESTTSGTGGSSTAGGP
ncbi:MAG: type II secretion system protein [Pirellulales bacterium]